MTAVPAELILAGSIRLLGVAVFFLVMSPRVFGPVKDLDGWDRSFAPAIWMTGALAIVGIAIRMGGGFGFVFVALMLIIGRSALGHAVFGMENWSRILDWWDRVQVRDLPRRVTAHVARGLARIARQVRTLPSERFLVPTAAGLLLALLIMPPSHLWSVSGPEAFTRFASALSRLEFALSGEPFAAGVRPVGLDVVLTQWNTVVHLNPLILTLLWPPLVRVAAACCVMYVGARVGGAPAAGLCSGFVYEMLIRAGLAHLGDGAPSALVAPMLAVLAFHYTRQMVTSREGHASAWTVTALVGLSGLMGWVPFTNTLLTSVSTMLGYAMSGGAWRRLALQLTTVFPLAFVPGTLALAWGLWSHHPVIPFWQNGEVLSPALMVLLAAAAVALWVQQLFVTLATRPSGSLSPRPAPTTARRSGPGGAPRFTWAAAAAPDDRHPERYPSVADGQHFTDAPPGWRSAMAADAAAVSWLCLAAALVPSLLHEVATQAVVIVAVSLAAAVLWRALEHPNRTRYLANGAAVLCLAGSLIMLWRTVPGPTPSLADSHGTDATIRAYIRIEASQPRGTWAAVDTSPYELTAGWGKTYPPTLWVHLANPVPGPSGLEYRGSPLKVQHVFLFFRNLASPTAESYADVELWHWYRTWLISGGTAIQYFHAGELTVVELFPQRSPTPQAVQ